ncbi:MAG: phosphoesterase, partial [Bacteroidota bacterium]
MYSRFFIIIIAVFSILGCEENQPLKLQLQDHQIATKWAEMTLHVTKYTPANSPTFASRCLGYIGLTMYESIVHGETDYNSLAGQLNKLETLPMPEKEQNYNWKLALNAGQAAILKHLYIQTADSNIVKIDSLEALILASVDEADQATKERSIAYGKSVANSIFEWSKNDGGHRGYLKNFDKEWKHPNHLGSWKPPLFAQSFSHHPLHPYWGKNRTFLAENAAIPNPEMISYDTAVGSPYYQQFLEVYEKDLALTQAEKEAAIWWGDDPDETFTPPGHSYYLATVAIEAKQPSLIKCAQTYARIGMSVADAFVMCWKWKY